MSSKFQTLTINQLSDLLSQERKKFLVAIDYGASGSDLEEIRDAIREMEIEVSVRADASRGHSEGRSSVA